MTPGSLDTTTCAKAHSRNKPPQDFSGHLTLWWWSAMWEVEDGFQVIDSTRKGPRGAHLDISQCLRPKPHLTPESARIDTNPLLEPSELSIFYYFGAAITESQYLVNLLLLQSLIMHHLTTGLSFTLLILFKSFCLFSHLFSISFCASC